MLLDEWDAQRSVKRVSNYANFSTDRKFDFLAKLSYLLSSQYSVTVFTKADLLEIYSRIAPDFQLPVDEGKQVIDEIESHNGLFVQSGYSKYEFSHKSLQEFLCADFMVKSPFISESTVKILEMPHEFAVACGLSTRPGHYLANLFLNKLGKHAMISTFLVPFLERLQVEKPDFDLSYHLGISYIYMYTIITRRLNDNRGGREVTDGFILLNLDTKDIESDYIAYKLISELPNIHPSIEKSINLVKNDLAMPPLDRLLGILKSNDSKLDSLSHVLHGTLRYKEYNRFIHTESQLIFNTRMLKSLLD